MRCSAARRRATALSSLSVAGSTKYDSLLEERGAAGGGRAAGAVLVVLRSERELRLMESHLQKWHRFPPLLISSGYSMTTIMDTVATIYCWSV